jgi:hypothetical protein
MNFGVEYAFNHSTLDFIEPKNQNRGAAAFFFCYFLKQNINIIRLFALSVYLF